MRGHGRPRPSRRWNERSLPALDPDRGRRDLPAPGRSRLRRAGRTGVPAGRSRGGPDRGSAGRPSPRAARQPKEEEMTKLRFVGLIAVLVVAASIAAASAQTRSGQEGQGPNGLELTYTKWIAPGFPNMVGVVGGDIVGKFGGSILERTVNGSLIHLDAIYTVIAPDPAKSFTARVEGTEDLSTL